VSFLQRIGRGILKALAIVWVRTSSIQSSQTKDGFYTQGDRKAFSNTGQQILGFGKP